MMGYVIYKLQNVSQWDSNNNPTVEISDIALNWIESLNNWRNGKNPTDSPEWKKGIFAITKEKA